MLTWHDTKPGVTFRHVAELISKHLLINYFPKAKLQHDKIGWPINMTSKLYYEPAKPSAFSNLKKIQEAAKQSKIRKKPSEIKSWPEIQDVYTLHKPLRRQFPRNPYTVNNLLDVCECDLVDGQFSENSKIIRSLC